MSFNIKKTAEVLIVAAFAMVKICFGLSVSAYATDPCSPSAPLTGGTQHCSSSASGIIGSYTWTIWSSGSGGCMTPYGVDAAFKATWNNSGDFLARVGKQWDETQTYDQIGTISADYAYTKTGSDGGFSFIGIYGWSNNPLIEYYIVDDWFGSGPPTGGGTLKGSFTVDDGKYNVYTHTQVNQPSIHGTTTFEQFFSIRQTARQCGHISISKHFEKWASLGMKLGKMYEAKILVEAGGGSGSINFSKGSVLVYSEPPTISSVTFAGKNSVAVDFSKPVALANAQIIGNYAIDHGVTISAATLDSNLHTVTLFTSEMSKDLLYTLTVNNVKDQATPANTIAANSQDTFKYQPLLVAINCGGDAYTDGAGVHYRADELYNSGLIYTTTSSIGGTSDDALFQTERYGNFAYNIPVPNDSYDVTLRFAEIYETSAGKRIFNVSAEGAGIISNLDVFDMAGAKKVYEVVKMIVVSDGVLNLKFATVLGNAKVNAIVVKPSPVATGAYLKVVPPCSALSVVLNPSHQNITVKISVPEKQSTSVKMYNLNGDLVATLMNSNTHFGTTSCTYNLGHLSTGVYIIRLQAGTKAIDKEVMVVK